MRSHLSGYEALGISMSWEFIGVDRVRDPNNNKAYYASRVYDLDRLDSSVLDREMCVQAFEIFLAIRHKDVAGQSLRMS